MSGPKPDAAVVRRAIEIYVRTAYPEGPPFAVRSMLAAQEGWAGDFFESPTFVKDQGKPPTRYTMRLGNRAYPHMKLVCELGPDHQSFLLKADSHVGHFCPPPSNPEHAAFRKLMETNQQIVSEIESAWAGAGIPTFKTFLKDDLARRRQEAGAS